MIVVGPSFRHLHNVTVNLLSKNIYYVVSSKYFSTSCSNRNQNQSNPKSIEPMTQVSCPPNSRLLKVAIIGVPNAGKSTLINKLMEFEVCPVSKKAHTTRANQKAIFLENETQVIFMDTPGVANKKETEKFGLTEEFLKGPENSVRDADVIAVIHDVANKVLRNRLDPRLITVLQKFPTKPSILIINKVDIIQIKRKLLETVYHLTEGQVNGIPIPTVKKKPIRPKLKPESLFKKSRNILINYQDEATVVPSGPQNQSISNQLMAMPRGPTPSYEEHTRFDENGNVVRGWPNFKDVFMISAIEGDGVDAIKEYFRKNARASPWEYPQDMLTDTPPAELCLRVVKSKMLQHFAKEVGYIIDPKLEYWDTNRKGELRIVVGMTVPHERLLKIIFSFKGDIVHAVKTEAEADLSQLLHIPVNLHLNVVMKAPIKEMNPYKQSHRDYMKQYEARNPETSQRRTDIDPNELL